MNKRLWVLNPLLLATALPAFAAQAKKKTLSLAPTELTAPSPKWRKPRGLSKVRR